MAGTAVSIEHEYGRVLRAPPYDVVSTARLLYRKLEELMPTETFSEQALKTWIQKYRGAVVAAPEGRPRVLQRPASVALQRPVSVVLKRPGARRIAKSRVPVQHPFPVLDNMDNQQLSQCYGEWIWLRFKAGDDFVQILQQLYDKFRVRTSFPRLHDYFEFRQQQADAV